MSRLLGVKINTKYDFVFQFYQTGLIKEVLEVTGVGICNGFPTSTKVESRIGTGDNGPEDKRDLTNRYDYFMNVMLYLA